MAERLNTVESKNTYKRHLENSKFSTVNENLISVLDEDLKYNKRLEEKIHENKPLIKNVVHKYLMTTEKEKFGVTSEENMVYDNFRENYKMVSSIYTIVILAFHFL
jgi:hypothetical protein